MIHLILSPFKVDDVSNKNSNPKDISKAIRSLGNLCRSHGVNQVLFSSLMPGKNFDLNNKVKRINFLLTLICQEYGFIFINNDNIVTEYLWKDMVSLPSQ